MNGKLTEGTLRIGLDLVNLTDPGEGLGRFAGQLVRGLASVPSGHEFVLFVREELAGHFAALSTRTRLSPVRLPRRRLLPWNQLAFLGNGRLGGLDILHSPVSVSPLLPGGRGLKRIVTVHDLAFIVSPSASSAASRAWWNFSWPRSLRGAAAIVTDSERTKQDVISRYSLREEKISVIYPYVSFANDDVPAGVIRRARHRYGLPARYILHVGAPHKRKNLVTLIRAFSLLKKNPSVPHALVLAGPNGWDDASLRKEADEARLGDEVVFTGFVADEDMPGVYAGADVLAFPSLYEGFGYPPLEAMACGTPVVVSNVSSLPEVVGDAALLVPPGDAGAIAGAILRVLTSPELSAKLRQAGRLRVGQFSKERMAREYLDVYEKVAWPRQDGPSPGRDGGGRPS
ncbi:MAG: glycosyltransferase family 1 protein [Candidatus Aminicenantales bacterium]|jgi:glycosyltransferase involved in cell wall biosynthesis